MYKRQPIGSGFSSQSVSKHVEHKQQLDAGQNKLVLLCSQSSAPHAHNEALNLSAKGIKTFIFLIFRGFEGPGPCPRPSPGLGIEFPVKNAEFGCVFDELLHFSSFLRSLEMFCAFWKCFARLGTVFRVLEAKLDHGLQA